MSLRGGKTLGLSPAALERQIGLVQAAQRGVGAASGVLRDYWEAVLRLGTDGAPQPRTFVLANSIRVTKIPATEPTNRVGTPIFYGRILHYGVPGRFEPMPHGDIALNLAEPDMNKAFVKAAQ